MCKAVNKKIIIGDIMLLEKSGGKSGTFIRSN
jgi:cyclic pyranopterin phosphate synthase